MALFNPQVFSSAWRYVSARDRFQARLHSARSKRNARWLVQRIERWSYIEVSDSLEGPFTSEWLPITVPGITDEEWDEFTRMAWS